MSYPVDFNNLMQTLQLQAFLNTPAGQNLSLLTALYGQTVNSSNYISNSPQPQISFVNQQNTQQVQQIATPILIPTPVRLMPPPSISADSQSVSFSKKRKGFEKIPDEEMNSVSKEVKELEKVIKTGEPIIKKINELTATSELLKFCDLDLMTLEKLNNQKSTFYKLTELEKYKIQIFELLEIPPISTSVTYAEISKFIRKLWQEKVKLLKALQDNHKLMNSTKIVVDLTEEKS